MKILVPLKRVPDPDTKIRVKSDGSGIETDGVKFAVNPFDAIALEEALRLREKIGTGEIVVVTIGGEECAEADQSDRHDEIGTGMRGPGRDDPALPDQILRCEGRPSWGSSGSQT